MHAREYSLRHTKIAFNFEWSWQITHNTPTTTSTTRAHDQTPSPAHRNPLHNLHAGALAHSNRKLLTVVNPGDRLVNAQVNLDKNQYKQDVVQVVARQDAIGSVSRALDHQAARNDKLDDRVESAADKAARLGAKAAFTGAIPDVKRATIASIKVEKAVRDVEQRKDNVADRTQIKVDVSALLGAILGSGCCILAGCSGPTLLLCSCILPSRL